MPRLLPVAAVALAAVPFIPAAGPAPAPPRDVRELLDRGRYTEAETAARERLAEAERSHGGDSLRAAEAIDLVVEAMWRGGRAKDPEAETLARRAVALKEARLGFEDPGVAASLAPLGHVLRLNGRYDAARPLLERALRIRKEALGPQHPDLAASLGDLGMLCIETDAPEEARRLYEAAVEMTRKTRGPDHPATARLLKDLARALRETGDVEGARSAYERAIGILEAAYGADHPDIASSLNGLAITLEELGDYSGARPRFVRALEIQRSLLGRDHFRVAATANNLGSLHRFLGQYSEARPYFEEAIRIWRISVGPEHPSVAESMANLAELLQLMGDYEEARSLYDRAIEVLNATVGPDDGRTVWTVCRLARLQQAMGDLPRARVLFERALSTMRATPGSEYTDDVIALGDLAAIDTLEGRIDDARQRLEEALAIQTKARGPDHPETATTRLGLARVLLESGEAERARVLAEQSLAARRRILGPEHPLVAESMVTLAEALAGVGRVAEAFDAALRAEEIGRDHLRVTVRVLPERQALLYASIRAAGLDLAVALAADQGRGIPGAASRVWDAVIRSRALVLDEMASRHRSIDGAAPDIRELEEKLTAARTRLANLVVRGPDEHHPDRYLDLVAAALRHKEEAERAFAERSSRYRARAEEIHASLSTVARALPADTALLSFSLYNHPRGIGARTGTPGGARSIPSFVALVLPPGSREPALVPLGAAAGIDDLVERWLHEASTGQVTAGRSASESLAAYRRAGESLRRALWDPVAGRVGQARRLFVVPDGSIHFVSFASLPWKDDGYFVEEGPLLHHLSAERDLLESAARRPDGRGLLAMGGPAFDEAGVFSSAGSAHAPPAHSGAPLYRGGRSACADLRGLRFDPLPASAVEAREVAALWGGAGGPSPARTLADAPGNGGDPTIVLLTGSDASETRLKTEASGRRVLHLATHGFFLGGGCAGRGAAGGGRGIGGVTPGPVAGSAPSPGGPAVESPLLASGLALAGFNQRARASPDEDDGVLTAEEIAALDLSGAEWVVLSACDTAAGDIRAGEGVIGLRRAFHVAGAATLIMSLWSVEDEATRRWMAGLYEARRGGRLDTDESVRRASLKLLAEQRRPGRTTHPFYWAGFVAEGDWR